MGVAPWAGEGASPIATNPFHRGVGWGVGGGRGEGGDPPPIRNYTIYHHLVRFIPTISRALCLFILTIYKDIMDIIHSVLYYKQYNHIHH